MLPIIEAYPPQSIKGKYIKIKYALGEEYDIDSLWHEYQVAVGDIKE